MKPFIALVAGLALAALPVARAGAQDPAPLPCTGTAITDPAGDQVVYPNPILGLGATTAKGPDNFDARSVFFRYEQKDGKPSLTANIQVTDLKPDLPETGADTGSASYFLDFAPAVGDISWVQATTDGTEFSYQYGKVNRVEGQGTVTTETATTGRAFLGKNGVLQIDIPLDVSGAKPGTKFEGLVLSISPELYAPADDAPDEGTKTYTVTECPAEAAPAAPTGDTTTPTEPKPQPQPQPQQQPQSQPQSSGGRVAPQLSFTVKPGRDKRPPFVFRTAGKLVPPSNVSRTDACQGRVSIQIKNGKKTVSNRRSQVRPDCTFANQVRLANRKRLGKARSLRVIVTFQGNNVLLPQKAKARSVRVR